MIKLCLFLAVIALAVCDPLLLTPYIKAGKLSQVRELSAVYGGKMGNSGFMTVPSASGKQNNNIFFWLQPCLDGCDADAPFIIWLQGGPGGPGMFGAFGEIGNWYVDFNDKTQKRCFSWCKKYNCLFVDQPTMTGFSYPTNSKGKFDPKNIEYTKTSKQAMEQVYGVVQQVFTAWPQYRAAPFYITGESYAGLYTAWLGYTIVNKNKNPINKPINFVGLAVGDPIMDWKYQMPTYPETLHSFGVIDDVEKKILTGVLKRAVAKLDTDCWGAFQEWNSIFSDDTGGGLPGLFAKFTGSAATDNVLLGTPPPAMDYWSKYLSNASIAEAFHFSGIPTSSSAEGGVVYHTMVNSTDFCTNSTWLFAKLFVEHNIDLMIYSSNMDTLLGPPTTEAGVQAIMDYSSHSLPGHSLEGKTFAQSYAAAGKVVWKTTAKDDNVAGYARCFSYAPTGSNANAVGAADNAGSAGSAGKRFCYTVVRNGGHELPSYEPRTSWDMINRFIQGRSFSAVGDDDSQVPKCAQCSGAAPFSVASLPDCHHPAKNHNHH